jgi:alkaline phosphatase
VIFGGGRQCLVSNVTGTTSDPIDTWACYRSDGRNLINLWETQKASENARFKVVSNRKELQKLDTKSLDYVLGVFNNGFMKYEYERDGKVDPSLADMTIAAIDILDKGENGFLLVVNL